MRENKSGRKYNRDHINWRIDYDYLNKLSDSEKEWLTKFTGEYYRNDFSDSAPPVHDLTKLTTYTIHHPTDHIRVGTVKQALMYEEYIRHRDVLYNIPLLVKGKYKLKTNYSSELYSRSIEENPESLIIDYIDLKDVLPAKEKSFFTDMILYNQGLNMQFNKEQLSNFLKTLNNVSGLLETGFFPGRKAVKVLEAIQYIHTMKQETHAVFKSVIQSSEGAATKTVPSSTVPKDTTDT